MNNAKKEYYEKEMPLLIVDCTAEVLGLRKSIKEIDDRVKELIFTVDHLAEAIPQMQVSVNEVLSEQFSFLDDAIQRMEDIEEKISILVIHKINNHKLLTKKKRKKKRWGFF